MIMTEGPVWTVNAKNRETGERRKLEVSEDTIREAVFDSVCPCTGECECDVEPDGVCPNGWPSILIAAGLI